MEYELKKLNSTHLFSMFRLINKFGVENFKDIFSDATKSIDNNGTVDKEKLAEQIGADIIFKGLAIFISNIGNCEKEVFEFLSSVSNLTKEQVSELSPETLIRMIKDVIMKKEFKGFFSEVSKLFK